MHYWPEKKGIRELDTNIKKRQNRIGCVFAASPPLQIYYLFLCLDLFPHRSETPHQEMSASPTGISTFSFRHQFRKRCMISYWKWRLRIWRLALTVSLNRINDSRTILIHFLLYFSLFRIVISSWGHCKTGYFTDNVFLQKTFVVYLWR